MNNLQFISSVIASLAWPTAVIIIVVIFKKPLSTILLSLRKFSFKDFLFDFSKEVEKLEVAADRANIPDIAPETKEAQETRKDIGARLLLVEEGIDEQIVLLAETAPASAIILAWTQLEIVIRDTTRRLKRIPEDKPTPFSVKQNIRLLAEDNAIDTETIEILQRMYELRNSVAHGQLEEITYAQAMEYARLAKRMITRLASVQNK